MNFQNHIELLERRIVKSSSLDGTSLLIAGTAGDDHIVVSLNPDDVSQLRVRVNDDVKDYAFDDVKSIRIEGHRGNDSIQVDDSAGGGVSV